MLMLSLNPQLFWEDNNLSYPRGYSPDKAFLISSEQIEVEHNELMWYVEVLNLSGHQWNIAESSAWTQILEFAFICSPQIRTVHFVNTTFFSNLLLFVFLTTRNTNLWLLCTGQKYQTYNKALLSSSGTRDTSSNKCRCHWRCEFASWRLCFRNRLHSHAPTQSLPYAFEYIGSIYVCRAASLLQNSDRSL